MDISFTDPWITLAIKAPNQQIEDQIIKCKLDWSVAKLKGYIHETYPNKPKTEDQRLIYSGQLLTDGVILKDVLRPYDEDGQLNLTIHLVCASSSCCTPKEKVKTESILKEIPNKNKKINEVNYGASTSGTSSSSSNASQEPNTSFLHNKQEAKTTENQTKFNSDNNVTRIPLTPEQLAVEQILWVNRMYAIQMVKYWQSVATRLGAPKQTNTQNVNNELPSDLPNNNNNNQPGNQNDVPGNNANRNVQDAGPNQDWLDWLYVSSRVLIFISVLYFYSSPGRFIVVAGFAFLLYLYQSGFFHHVNENDRPRFQPEQLEPHVDDYLDLLQRQNGNTNNTSVRQNESLITTICTVIISFFTSLIPHQYDVI